MKKLSRVQSLAAQSTLCVFLLTAGHRVFTACQSYEPFSEEEVFKGAYERNFIRTFGQIAPTQTWDFSRSTNVKTRTRSATDYQPLVDENGWLLVDAAFYGAITQNTIFTDKATQSFALQIGEDACFDIFPVFQTPKSFSGLSWSLQAIVEGTNILNHAATGWPMGTNMQVMKNGRYVAINDEACTSKGTRVKAIAHYDNTSGEKELMYLNLCITDYFTPPSEFKKYAPKGTQQSSLAGQMRVVDIPRPALIDSRLQTLFIACEAANFDASIPYSKNGGKRYQSLVLMLVGPRVPEVLYLDDQALPVVHPTIASKRYMIEDLGSTSDFDFNDIVVDVLQTATVPVQITQTPDATSSNALRTTVSLGEAESTQTQAMVSHLCGTKPFQLTVGDQVFKKVTDPTNEEQTLAQLHGDDLETETYFEGPKTITGWNPNATATITGWRPEENNISIKVWRNGTGTDTDGGWLVQFPAVGNVPFVMALPVKTSWSAEGTEFTQWKEFVSPSAATFAE